MTPAPLPALPADVWGRITREALAAEGSTMPAWLRLGLVCRAWRENLRGAQTAGVVGSAADIILLHAFQTHRFLLDAEFHSHVCPVHAM